MNPIILANLLREYLIRLRLRKPEGYCHNPYCHDCGLFVRQEAALLALVNRIERHIIAGKRLSITQKIAEMHLYNLPYAWSGKLRVNN